MQYENAQSCLPSLTIGARTQHAPSHLASQRAILWSRALITWPRGHAHVPSVGSSGQLPSSYGRSPFGQTSSGSWSSSSWLVQPSTTSE